MKALILVLSALSLVAQDAPKPNPKPEDPAQQAKEAGAEAKQTEAAPAAADATARDTGVSGSVDLGYRWLDFRGGDFQTYRSVVNLGEGPKIFGVDALIKSADRKFFDKITLYGTGWGGDPYTTARIGAFKERTYDLRVDYRNIAYYNFLPSYANPLLERGFNLTESAFDTRIRAFDSELRLRPGTRVMPFFGFDRDADEGAGITTFVQGGNEYPVWNQISDQNRRYRGGVQFQLTNFHSTLEVGGNTYKDDQGVAYSGFSIGNRPTAFLGRRLSLSQLGEYYRIRGDSKFARGLISWNPTSKFDLSGFFLYSMPENDVNYVANATGSLANTSTLQFYQSLSDYARSYANQPHASGGVNVEVRPFNRLRLINSINWDAFHVASSVLVSTTTTANGVVAAPVVTSPTDRTQVNYNREQGEAIFDLFSFLTIRGGYRYVWGDADWRGGLTTGVPREFGKLEQNVWLGGVQFRLKQRLTINGDLEKGSTDHSYFRTSLWDYQRSSIRARYQAAASLSFNVMHTLTTNTNPTQGINLDFLYRQSSAGLQWNPKASKRFGILAEYTHAQLRSDISFLEPPFLSPAVSQYRDYSHTVTGLIELAPLTGTFAPHLTAGGSYFKSSGSRPTGYYQPEARLSIPVTKWAQWNTEWRFYEMNQTFYLYEGFRANVFTTGVRFMR